MRPVSSSAVGAAPTATTVIEEPATGETDGLPGFLLIGRIGSELGEPLVKIMAMDQSDLPATATRKVVDRQAVVGDPPADRPD